jgi:hypothetical protein
MSDFSFGFDAFGLLGEIDWGNVDFGAISTTPSTAATPAREISDVRGTNGSFRMSTVPKGDATGVDMTFIFPFLPAQMQVNDLGDNYAEISRPQLIPLVEFSSHKLMKFQMEFLLSFPGDGIKQTVDSQIEFLRRMATSKQGIVFSNGSGILMNPLYYAGVVNTNNMFFYITDMGVNIQRFLPDNSGVAAATVSMSFTEVRNPVQKVVKLPKIKYTPTPPKPKSGGKKGTETVQIRYSDTLPGTGKIVSGVKTVYVHDAKPYKKKK